MDHAVRPVRAEEWPAVKELRLAALQDPMAPLAFLETYEDALTQPDLFWQRRTLDGAEGRAVRQFVAEGPDGTLSGTVTVLLEEAGGADPFGGVVEQRQGHVVGVFVRPEQRGRGLIEALFEAALEWAWSLEGLERVRLFVDERNTRAERAYRKAGFAPSGHTAEVPDDPSVRDVELVLHRPGAGKRT